MKVPLVDLKAQYNAIRKDVDSAIDSVIQKSNFILGDEVSLLEQEIADYTGAKYGVGVSSGTDALVLALTALDIGDGDEVITTPFTFIATSESIVRVGARPVFCDVEKDTLNIDPDKIEKHISSRTKAVVVVHLYGMPCRMERVQQIARTHNLRIVEDCAQAFGSEYKGRKVGTLGDCGCFSFFPAKNLGCYGDGGMVVTDDESIANRIRMLRNHGSTKKYYYGMHGFNSRLDTIQAAVLRVKLKYIDRWIDEKIRKAALYNELLSDSGIISVPPAHGSGFRHSFNYYTVRIQDKRDIIRQYLKENGVASAVYYPLSLHLQDVYRYLDYKKGDFPVAERAQEEVLSLPIYPELAGDIIQDIVRLIKERL